jgi:hypothetical protein
MRDAGLPGSAEQLAGAADVHLWWASDQVDRPDRAASGGWREGGGVDDDLRAGDRLGDSPPGGEVALNPLDRRVVAGPARQDAHLVALVFQQVDDATAQVPSATGDENQHARPLLCDQQGPPTPT